MPAALPFEAAAAALRSSRSVLITVHQRPDGDALGSQLALSIILGRLGVKVWSVNDDPVPERYKFLPHVRSIKTSLAPSLRDKIDTAIVLECARLSRAGAVGPLVRKAPVILNMDHHLGNAHYGAYNLVDPHAPATVVLVETLRACLDVPVNKDIALNLYVGLYTETGGFRYSNTTPEILEFASRLVAAGVNPKWVGEQVYERHPLRRMKLLARALATLKVDDGISWMSVSEKDFSELKGQEDDVEDFVEYPRMIRGIKVAIFMRETKAGNIRVSLRSKADVPLNLIASHFGGGGHSYAAGCTLHDVGLEAAMRRLTPVIRRHLRMRGRRKKR